MAKRFLTYFGVHIPPVNKEKYKSTSTTIRFVIKGNVPSKKNNQQAVTIRKIARDWVNAQKRKGIPPSYESMHHAISMTSSKMRGNVKYIEFVEKYKPIIRDQMIKWSERLQDKGLIFPLSKATMTLTFYFKGRYITDSVNKQQSIQDLLVDCGVLANDDYRTLNPITTSSSCHYEEIIEDIAFISLTTNLIK